MQSQNGSGQRPVQSWRWRRKSSGKIGLHLITCKGNWTSIRQQSRKSADGEKSIFSISVEFSACVRSGRNCCLGRHLRGISRGTWEFVTKISSLVKLFRPLTTRENKSHNKISTGRQSRGPTRISWLGWWVLMPWLTAAQTPHPPPSPRPPPYSLPPTPAVWRTALGQHFLMQRRPSLAPAEGQEAMMD